MKLFLYKSSFWVMIVLLLHIIAVSFADGYFNSNYKRVTSTMKTNLIIGTSRAAQGIVPKVLLNKFGSEFFNFSFNIGVSPYGPIYEQAIREKLDTSFRNQIFIVAVDPWSVSTLTSNVGDDSGSYREKSLWIGQTATVNSKYGFNIQSLKANISRAWGGGIIYESLKSRAIEVLLNNKSRYPKKFLNYLPNGFSYLSDDGWLQVHLKDTTDMFLEHRLSGKVAHYRETYLKNYSISENRLKSLISIIKFFKDYGDVIIVRLPIQEKIMEIEKEYCPDFDIMITDIAKKCRVPYSNLNGMAVFKFSDGNHLLNTYAEKNTELIISRINYNQN